jgi:hypothetical protein
MSQRGFFRNERGAVVPIFVLFLTVLFGFMALAVDVARLYQERRQLSNAADFSSLAGAQYLWKSKVDAESAAKDYVAANPSVHHPGPYSSPGGDLVDARRQAEGTGCGAKIDTTTGGVTLDPNYTLAGSVPFDCLVSKVTAPNFEFVFASALGFEPRSISVTATAVMGNAAPKGQLILPWLLRDCPNSNLYPEELALEGENNPLGVPECPYKFLDTYSKDPSLRGVTKFKEGINFSGAALPYQEFSGGCPLPDGFKTGPTADSGNSTYQSLLSGTPGYTPCRVAPGMRMDTRGGALGTQTNGALAARGISTSTCANEAAFNSDLGNTGNDDGFVTINKLNPCMVIVMFATHAAPPSRVPSVVANFSGTPTQMQALIDEPGSQNSSRFSNFSGSNQRVVIRRFAWYYITGFDATDNKPVGVYLRAIENDSSILWDNMDACPASQSVSECAQSGVYITKLVD